MRYVLIGIAAVLAVPGAILITPLVLLADYIPCNGNCMAYFDWQGGGPSPECGYCRRKRTAERTAP
jgi:hypothetical protein